MSTQYDTFEVIGFPRGLREDAQTQRVNPQSSRLKITARGQAVLVGLVTIVIAIIVGMFTFGVTGANASTTSGANDFTYVSIQSGQSLWQLAEQLDPQADPRDLIAEIVQLNALPSSSVEVGQRIALPARFS